MLLNPREAADEEVFDFADLVALEEPGWLAIRTTPGSVASLADGRLSIAGHTGLDDAQPQFVGRRQRHLTATVAVQQNVYSVGADPYDVAALGLLPVLDRYGASAWRAGMLGVLIGAIVEAALIPTPLGGGVFTLPLPALCGAWALKVHRKTSLGAPGIP